MRVPFEREEVKMLCCPEDVACPRFGTAGHSQTECCEECIAPVCNECAKSLDSEAPSLPPAALSNDMMIYYAPAVLYVKKVTVMEMICASVCVTSMICFTLEKKYRNCRSMDEDVHSNTYRMAARGNATSFPLPWQDLLVQLQDSERFTSMGKGVSLPRAGVELANVVSIWLKTAGSDKDETVSARFIHQATVRREVVIELIEEMKRRGHSAYKHVDMDAVRERAEGLPEDDVPPEIIRLLPLDGAHDKLQPNKNATPVSGEGNLDDVRKNLEVLRYNAVVNEKSSLDEGDEPAQVRACNVVSILLKTAGSDKDETVSARFIHQATVRREVVIELIEEMKRRGHSAYKHVDMDAVRERAKGLPEDDVPPESIRLLPLDGAHDKLQPNKNATPVSGDGSLDEVRKNLEVRRYNAVVNEKAVWI